jgi:hypothetical protein
MRKLQNRIFSMHQLSPLRHAVRLSEPSVGFTCQRRFLSTWPAGRSFVVHSPDFSSGAPHTKLLSGRTIVVDRGGRRQQLRAVQDREEPGAGAPIETLEGGNAWEINLANEDVRVLAKFKSL